jgi:hypothetical protein
VSDHGHVPALRIVRGDPSAEQLAALVAVLAAASGAAEVPESTRDESRWAPPDRLVRAPLAPGGWWASALPR